MIKAIAHICYFVLTIHILAAQSSLSGSFETNSIYYHKDSKSQAVVPEDKIGSNNYFKLDYNYNKLKVGVQYESYLPVLQGYSTALHGSELVFKYAAFQDSNMSVTVGDFYEQFGNGLIFRAYEERSIGLNTALEGVRLTYKFNENIRIKGLLGRSREFMEKAESTVKGASLSVDVGNLLQWKKSYVFTEFNYLNRYLNYTGQEEVNPNVQAYSFNGNWSLNGFSLQGEYAYKTADKSVYSNQLKKAGTALLLELGYTAPGFGGLFTFRRLEYMSFGTTRGITGVGRDLNYLPALTKQQSYSLASLTPYNTMGNEEIGGQLDLQYRLRSGSFLGGKYGTKIALNASTYYNLKGNALEGYHFLTFGKTKYYQDINLEVDRKFSTQLKGHILFANQVFNPLVLGKENTLNHAQIAAGDLQWKSTENNAFRFELQHLWSSDYYKNWAASLVEFSKSNIWTCFMGDMYNYGDSKVHYYHLGGSYVKSRTRFALKYGRYREGIVCVGGVCLYMPAYTGINLAITSSF